MKTKHLTWALALLTLAALQGCSDKTVNAPAPAVVQVPVPATAPTPAPGATAAPASAAVPAEAAKTASGKKIKPLLKAATMECKDRKVVLEATCHDLVGPEMLQCSKQSLVISDNASGKVLNTRNYAGAATGDMAGYIEEKVGEMTCVTTKAGGKYIVTNMFNGGNCEGCEWNEVYSWDGAFLGSDRDKKKKVQVVDDAVAAITEKDVDRVTGVNDVAGFYSEPPPK
jgi:hypothetical protein